MARRIASTSLLCAWLCASGAMLDLAQVVAWSRMFSGYARTESMAAAARDTFDPGRPCAICRALSRARETSGQRAPAVPSAGADRMVLVLESAAPFIVRAAGPEWPEERDSCALAREADVPVPPPRPALA
jgi:hypothetical protein